MTAEGTKGTALTDLRYNKAMLMRIRITMIAAYGLFAGSVVPPPKDN